MRRLAVLAAILALTASATLAASVHFKQNRDPSFIDGGVILTASGALAGLGNGDVLVSLVAHADTVSTCTNPAGQTQPPGQNPAPITVAGSEAIPASEVKNGTTPFLVTTEAPVTIIPGAPDCPNPQWTERIQDLKFTSAIVTVQQPPGTVVLSTTCTFTPATSDGQVPRAQVSCN
jgi:hypothetical protein